MGAVEDVAVKGADVLLGQGPIGLLALVACLCVVVLGFAVIAMWRALRTSEAARIEDLKDQIEAADKERADMDRKMDILQAVIEAQKK